ncbi:hypothetical protein [Acinetobacter radioresistens]|uniref:hypothetical protein n=1 Tax=Acinetobacter radioresistens TaxID=40216 RepID=UPI0022470040|nr:hypothetical protein [Acinetobacter radioresistens]MCX0339450.1 hypothetical protein [Acinetobacter radioresistens]
MCLNQKLKYCLFEFLSNRTFSGYEFKDIRQTFISSYPEYRAKKFYSKIYQAIRELVDLKLILVDMRTCTYKYTSNYSRGRLLALIDHNESINVENCLTNEYRRVIECLSGLQQELNIYSIYLKKFPMLSELIANIINKKEAEIQLLKYELNAIKSLIEAC